MSELKVYTVRERYLVEVITYVKAINIKDAEMRLDNGEGYYDFNDCLREEWQHTFWEELKEEK